MIEEHIKNLEKYCKDDIEYRSQTAEEEKSDFDIFCDNHISDIQAAIKELRSKEADLYVTNNSIKDLLETINGKDKRIADLEFSLMDMVLQFADEDKNSINTMGLSALEIAFSELNFDDPMPIKKAHKIYKELAKKYYKEGCKNE